MPRAILARLGVLAAVVVLPACSGGGAAVPAFATSAATGSQSVAASEPVRQTVDRSSASGDVVPAAATSQPVPSASSPTSTSSLVESVVRVPTVLATALPSAAPASVSPSSVSGHVIRARPSSVIGRGSDRRKGVVASSRTHQHITPRPVHASSVRGLTRSDPGSR